MTWPANTPGTPSRTSTPEHTSWRTAVLLTHPQCQLHYPNRCTGTSTEADHIVEVSDGGPPYARSNGQGVCAACHAHKTALHANQKRWANRGNYQQEIHPALR